MRLPDVRLQIVGAIAFEYCTADRAWLCDLVCMRLLMPSQMLVACEGFCTSFAVFVDESATVILWFLDDLVER